MSRSKNKESYLLNLDISLMNRIRSVAKEEGRSIASVIVEALVLYFRIRDRQKQMTAQ